MKCPHCGQEHPDNAKFCMETGLKIEPQTRVCNNPECSYRNPLPLTAQFCPNCGRSLNGLENGKKGSDKNLTEGRYKCPARFDEETLKTIDPEQVDTSGITDMEEMFDDSISLESLDLSGWNTSSVTNMHCMFQGCESLKTLDLSGWDISSVTDMGWMFNQCISLKSVDLSGWDTSSVTNMHCMFQGCESLKILDLSGLDISSVTDMGWMFNCCESLESLDVSGWDTSSVTDMSHMFAVCNSLKSLDLSGWDTSSVINMSEMFYECESLESLDLSGWNTSSVTNVYHLFDGCFSLKILNLSEWEISSPSNRNMRNMFYRCKSLKKILMKGCNAKTIDKIKKALKHANLDCVEIITDDTIKKKINNKQDFVDMGGSVLWATCNLGANTPEAMGKYFSWGENKTKSNYTEEDYLHKTLKVTLFGLSKKIEYIPLGSNISGTKYDVVSCRLGHQYMLPSKSHFKELEKHCLWSKGELNGVKGWWVKNPQNENKLFFPAMGYKEGNDIRQYGICGCYPTGDMSSNGLGWHWELKFLFNDDHDSSNDFLSIGDACGLWFLGYNVRAIKKKY